MTITLSPEHERIIQAPLATGEFCSVKEVLDRVLAPFKPETSNSTGTARAQAAAVRIRELRQGVTLDRPEGFSLREYAHPGHIYQ